MLLPFEEKQKMELPMPGAVPAARQLTPPDSPRSSDQIMLPPIKKSWTEESRPKPSGKMSLDFIAPNSRSSSPENMPPALPRLEAMIHRMEALSEAAAIHRGSRPSSPFHPSAPVHPSFTSHNSPHHKRPQPPKDEYYSPIAAVSGGLPSPVWSTYAEPQPNREGHTVHFNLSYRDRSSSDPAYGQPHYSRPPLFTPPGTRPSRIQKRSPRAPPSLAVSRGERHPYDAEERFALVYLRREDFEKKLEWKDVLTRYHLLFPPGTPRRFKSKDGAEARGLPSCYPQREVQGLQCRFYRIRTEEDLPKTRDAASVGGIDTPAAREAIAHEMGKLDEMAVRDRLSLPFVKRVKQLAAKGDLNEILAYGLPRL